MFTSFYVLLILFFLKTALISALSGTFTSALSSVLAASRSLPRTFSEFSNSYVGLASTLTFSGSRTLALWPPSVASWHDYHLALDQFVIHDRPLVMSLCP
jgi:hypothetical protein